MKETYANLRRQIAETRSLLDHCLDNLDITGGERGMRNNDKLYKQQTLLKKQLMRLNKAIINFNPPLEWGIGKEKYGKNNM